MTRTMARVVVGILASGSLSAQHQSAAPEDWRDPQSATWLSLGATVVPMALGLAIDSDSETGGVMFGLGLLLGPAVGYLVTDQPQRALAGIGIRAGIGLAGTLLMVATCSNIFECSDVTGVVAIATLGAIGTSAIVDIVRVRRREVARVTLGPRYLDQVGAWGLGVSASF